MGEQITVRQYLRTPETISRVLPSFRVPPARFFE